LQRPARSDHTARLDGLKTKRAIRVGGHATKTRMPRAVFIRAGHIASADIGLPKLEQRVADRLVRAVEHATGDGDQVCAGLRLEQPNLIQRRHPDRKERTDGLRSCG
jgi:hypothetical protein